MMALTRHNVEEFGLFGFTPNKLRSEVLALFVALDEARAARDAMADELAALRAERKKEIDGWETACALDERASAEHAERTRAEADAAWIRALRDPAQTLAPGPYFDALAEHDERVRCEERAKALEEAAQRLMHPSHMYCAEIVRALAAAPAKSSGPTKPLFEAFKTESTVLASATVGPSEPTTDPRCPNCPCDCRVYAKRDDPHEPKFYWQGQADTEKMPKPDKEPKR